jgi:hypothetical protein
MEHPTLGYIVVALRISSMLIAGGYSFPMFIYNLRFFMRIKKQDKYTLKRALIIGWIYFMWLAKLLHALGLTLFVSLAVLIN